MLTLDRVRSVLTPVLTRLAGLTRSTHTRHSSSIRRTVNALHPSLFLIDYDQRYQMCLRSYWLMRALDCGGALHWHCAIVSVENGNKSWPIGVSAWIDCWTNHVHRSDQRRAPLTPIALWRLREYERARRQCLERTLLHTPCMSASTTERGMSTRGHFVHVEQRRERADEDAFDEHWMT